MTRDLSTPFVALLGAILMTGCAAPPASSEPQGVLPVRDVAGAYRLQAVGGDMECHVALGNLLIDGALPVRLERCETPEIGPARTWRTTARGFELLGANGRVVMAFRRTGEDAFEAIDRRYRLTRAPVS